MNMSKCNELQKKCRNLSFVDNLQLTASERDNRIAMLENLYQEYGVPKVLGCLAELWSFEQAATLCSQFDDQSRHLRKIKTIATSFYRAYDGGTERVNAELMTLWVKMGYRVILLTEEAENALDFPYPKEVKREILPKYAEFTKRLEVLETICKEEQVDVFVNHHWNHPKAIWECLLMKHLQIPHVSYCHANFAWSIGQGRDGLFQAQALSFSDLVIAISATNARFYQMNGCNTYLVQNPIPSDLKMVTPANLKSKHVLMVGRLSWEKYPLEALEIFKFVHEALPDVIFDIVGSGDLEAEAKAYVTQNQLQQCVIFHGKKNAAEIATFYQQSACELFTSKMEGYPMVVLETKAHGVPLVMYDLPYLSLLQPKKGVLTADAGDYRTMADHLIRLLKDDSYRGQMGKEARESFETLCSYDLEETWKSIFGILSGDNRGKPEQGYYGAELLPEADRYIMPTMLSQVIKSYDALLSSSVNYKVGKAVLTVPRVINNLLKRIRNRN